MNLDGIKTFFKGEIETSPDVCKKYNRDASIFEVTPSAVLYPKDTDDLKKLVRWVKKRIKKNPNLSLTARNGGTCMSAGSLTTGIMIDMSKYFNHINEINTQDSSIIVQGGVMHLEVEKATHPHNLLFAPYTSSRDICGIGGMIGNNASGEKSVKYGPTSANVGKLKVLLSDGNEYEFGPLNATQLEEKKKQDNYEGFLYKEVTKMLDDNWELIQHRHPKVKKNAAGYALWDLWDEKKETFNMARLFVGSQGTLGFVTEAQLKLVPFSKASRMIVVPISALSDLAPVVTTLLKFKPETCETFDYHTYDLAKQYHPEDAKRAPVADGKHMVVFAIYAGETQEEADHAATDAKNAVEALGKEVSWIDDAQTLESLLLIRRKSFKMLLEHPHDNQRAMAYLEDSIVSIDRYGEFLASLEKILSEYEMTYTYAGHIGDGSIRLVPLVNMEKPDSRDMIIESATRVYDLVLAFGGSISVDHNDGIIRTPYLEQMYGEEMVALFAEIKKLFDPLTLFNPGKKVGGTLEYAYDHIITSNA